VNGTLAAAAHLSSHIDQLIAAGRCRSLLDLRTLTFCDATGRSACVRGNNACTKRGGWPRVTGQLGHLAASWPSYSGGMHVGVLHRLISF
jgi:hypothetical protein